MKIHFVLLKKDITILWYLLYISFFKKNKIAPVNLVEYKEIKSCIFIKYQKVVADGDVSFLASRDPNLLTNGIDIT